MKIENYIFEELDAERYWSFPKNYKKDPKVEAKSMIFSGDYVGARKYDGAYYRFIKEDNEHMRLQGRSRSVSGEYLNKIDHVPHLNSFFESLPNGTCLIGELVFPENEGSNVTTTIMGCLTDKAIKRQETNKLYYYIFDVWAWGGVSLLNASMDDRLQYLDILKTNHSSDYVMFADYLEGEELWYELQSILANGGEGVVITKRTSHPEPGKRTARKTLKIKRELQDTIDCFFTGKGAAPTKLYSGKSIESWKYWVNEHTDERFEGLYWEQAQRLNLVAVTKPYFYRWAGSLEIGVLKDGKEVPIGWLSGVEDNIKANWKDYRHTCIEVTAMMFTPDGMLRHGKLHQMRPDLTIEECTWEKIFDRQ